MKYLVGLLLGLALTVSAQNSFAGYAFQAADATDLTTLGNTTFGDGSAPVQLKLYLVNIPAGTGAFSASGATFNLGRTASTGGPGAFAGTDTGPGFDFALVTPVNATTIRYTNALFLNPPPNSGLVNGMQAIEVGTLDVVGPAGSTQTFSFLPAGGSNDVNVNPDGNITASVFGNSASFTVSVPEPGSMALVGLLGGVLAFRRRRSA